MLNIPAVSIYRGSDLVYPESPPFNPGEEYSEYCFAGRNCLDASNKVYGAVRESLALLGLDRDHFGSVKWNPLGSLVSPGDIVLIKPNAVLHINHKPGESVFASITHGSVLRVIVDYVHKALNGQGKIIIADAPLAHSNFEEWMKLMGLQAVVDLYQQQLGFEIQVFDLRNLYVPWDYDHDFAPSHLRERTERDPAGYVEVDLGSESAFAAWSDQTVQLMYGSDVDRKQTVHHHLRGHHRYKVAKSVLEADVLISVPKLKVHSKVGVTLNIKGMVGTQGDKNYIPHHLIGLPANGGDEYPDQGLLQNTLNRYRQWLYSGLLAQETLTTDMAYKALSKIFQTGQHVAWKLGRIQHGDQYRGPITGGGWHGNDTAWRMALDLIRIVLYADRSGKLCDASQRKFFSIVDGIVGGEGEGPLSPAAKHCGVILAGFNPLAVDMVATRLMGFDPFKIKMLAEGLKKSWLKLWPDDAVGNPIHSNVAAYRSMMTDQADGFLTFQPPNGWRNRVEIGAR